MKSVEPVSTSDESTSKEIQHVTKELYKQNLELAERNKTLLLLRKIDEIVLNEISSTAQISERILKTIADETSFVNAAAMFLVNKSKKGLITDSIVIGSAASNDNFDNLEIIKQLRLFKTSLQTKNVLSEVATHRNTQVIQHFSDLFTVGTKRHIAQELDGVINTKAVFICPLISRGELIGILALGTRNEASAVTAYQRNLIDRLSGVVGIAVDNKILYEAIQEATERVRIQNQKLKELDEAKDEFISMASHQLRTPLTAIKGYLSMLLEGDAGKLSGKEHEFTDLAYVSAERMVFLISDMLNVSRINTGKLVIDLAPVDLEKVIKDEIKQLERTALARTVTLEFKPVVGDVPHVNLDEGKMRQVIMNFMDNAIYYSPNSTVEIYLSVADGKIRFEVKDHGIGVSEKEKAHLFTKFFRAENAQKARPDGTGLGLYMAKMVIQMQGGQVIFDSTEGKGSTFGFEFNLADVALKKTAPEPAHKSAILKPGQ